MPNIISKYFSGPYFPAFGLNTEFYSVNLRIQPKCGKIQTRKIPNTDTFCNVFSNILPILYQNKTGMPGNLGSSQFHFKKQQAISTIHKLCKYNVCWNYLKFSMKKGLFIGMRTFNKSKHRQAIYLKIEDLLLGHQRSKIEV